MINIVNAHDLALQQGDQFFNAGYHEAAITEYKRFIFFNPHHLQISEAEYKIGLAYRSQGLWKEAVRAMRQAMTLAASDSLKDLYSVDVGITFLAGKEYSLSEFELLQAAYFSDFSDIRQKAFFFLGVCYLYTSKWGEAQKAFEKYFDGRDFYRKERLDSLFSEAQSSPYKSPGLAKWLSTFIPGAGQIYSGDWGNGLNALTLNSLTTYLMLDALIERRFQDAVISYLTPFERYYRGNRFHAERIATEYNNNLSQHWSQKILDELRNHLKPPEEGDSNTRMTGMYFK